MKIETGSLIFMDIETVAGKKSYDELPEQWQYLWEKKNASRLTDEVTAASYFEERAALYAEFSRVVCISFGYYNAKGKKRILRLKSLYGENEKQILKSFCDIITQFEGFHKGWIFAGHNIKEFDLPFLSRRILINGLSIPASMDFYNLKPWEYQVVDTMHIWRFGDFKNYTSLDLMAASLGVPSPKEDIDGSRVAEVFWQGDYKRIAEYCQRDVVAVANIIQRLNGKPLLTKEQIEVADDSK